MEEEKLRFLPMELSDVMKTYIMFNEYTQTEISRTSGINMTEILDSIKIRIRDEKIEELLREEVLHV